MITAKFDVTGVVKRIEKLVSQSGNLGGVFDKIVGPPGDTNQFTIRGGFAATFYGKGSNLGTQWAPLNAKYFERKQKKYPGMTTLIASGNLFQSLNNSNFYTVDVRTKTTLSYGTIVPYAIYHQSDGPRKSLPRRQFMGPTPEQIARWKVLIQAGLTSGGAE